ncbi:MAG TPA: NDP-sugar synthase [Dehalococcoidales bacterium]|nr:NDP-sugar synthase [Dehalococcoidales bacterium]
MKAVILVGGQATRLRPLTTNTPKAMVPILNTPFLEHVFRHLHRHRVSDIILAQHHLAGPIEDYLGDGGRFGVRVTYVIEESPRGTAGAIRNVERYLDETFLVLNGDIFTDLDITAMVDLHRQRGAVATIALTPVEDPTAYGLIETDVRGGVMRFLEKPDWSQVTTNMINAGTYVLEPEVLARIPPERQVSIERETFPLLVDGGEPVYAYPSSGYWMDMGTPEKYLQLHRDLLGGRSTWHSLASPEEVRTGERCNIHPTAQIKEPAVIGDGCSIGPGVKLVGPVVVGDGCTIGEGSVVEDSVLWWQVSLGERVVVRNSAVANDCRLESGSSIDGSVLGDHVTVAPGSRLETGSRIEPGTAV